MIHGKLLNRSRGQDPRLVISMKNIHLLYKRILSGLQDNPEIGSNSLSRYLIGTFQLWGVSPANGFTSRVTRYLTGTINRTGDLNGLNGFL